MTRSPNFRPENYSLGTLFWDARDPTVRFLADESESLISTLGLDGSILYTNAAWSAALGYSATEAVELNLFDVLHPDSHDHCKDVFENLVSGRSATFYEATFVAKDGASHNLQGTALPAVVDGVVVGVVSFISPGAQEVPVLKDLFGSNAALLDLATQAIVETSLDALLIMDHHGRIREFNRTAESMFGHKRVDVLGRLMGDVIVPLSMRESHAKGLKRFLESREPKILGQRLRLSALRADGTEFPVELTVTQIPRHEPPVFAGAIRDITPEADYERELNAIRELSEATAVKAQEVVDDLTRLIDTANAPIFGIDSLGLVNEWNQAAAKITGYSKEEAWGRELVREFITDEYQASVGEVLAAALGGYETANFEFPLYSKKGTRVQVLLNATSRRDASGKVIGMVGVGQDVTEMDRARAELEFERGQLAQRVEDRTADLTAANIELAQSSLFKDRFMASMSHELRTPLNTVLGMSEALVEGAYGPTTDKQRASLALIHESGSHLLSLINDILDVAKIEAGQLKLDLAPCSITDLCESSVRMIRPASGKKRLQFTFEDESAPDSAVVDYRRLKQALVNLLSNAVKFTPEGGEFGLSVSKRREGEDEFFTMQVWDKGIGIPEGAIESLFVPFQQIENELTSQQSGTGLGLVIAKRMTELHGGTLHLGSVEGEGTRVTITLPLVLVSNSKESPARVLTPKKDLSPAVGETRIRLLLADDNENNIRTYAGYLMRRNMDVALARDGVEAVAMAISEDPEVILMDVQMPRMDGLEAIARIRANGGDMPIIALTALATDQDRERCLAAGADAYLSKPVRLKLLLGTIHNLVRTAGGTNE